MTGRDEIELQRFYERWAPHVLLFCRLYIGEAETAEHVVEVTFLKYFRAELPLHIDHLPAALMSLAVDETAQCGDGDGSDVDSDFEWAVLALPPQERAVFILHGPLELPLHWVAAMKRLPSTAVSQLWIRALLRLRFATVKDGCSRLFEEYGTAPKAAAGSPA